MAELVARGGAAGIGFVRRCLWPLAAGYALVMHVRNAAYESGWLRSEALTVPVVSVGNLTMGGTGKTPMVAWLVRRAQAAGRRPGVLARGYRRARGEALNDEGKLLRRRFPDLLQVQDPDRLRGGRQLVAAGADYVILDDGFQHRRLRRSVDLVCLDAESPFDGGMLLPAGNLREPPGALGRARIAVLTRAGALALDELHARFAAVREFAGDVAVYAAEHRPQALIARPGGEALPPAALRGRRVVLVSAIGNPRGFANTVRTLGAEVLAHHVRRDHDPLPPALVEGLAASARAEDAWLVTTEKDDVKLEHCAAPRHVLTIELEFLGAEPTAAELGLR